MINIERLGDIEVITINRPKAGNSISSKLTSQLLTELERLHKDCDIHSLIITGIGQKFFCTGGDVKEYRTINDVESLNYHFDRTRRAMDLIESLKCPVITAINGYALGGGAELILCTDYRIAAATAEIGWPQARLGIIPAWNGIDRLVRDCGPRVASKLMMTGDRIPAEKALKLGIIDEIVKTGDCLDTALKYAISLKQSSPQALKATKSIIKEVSKSTPGDVRTLQRAIFPDLWFSTDHKEAEAAFAEKRPPVFKGK